MKIRLSKFGRILVSRPAGREAFGVIQSYLKPKSVNEPIEIDFAGVHVMAPSWLDEILDGLKKLYGKSHIKMLPSKNPSVQESLKILQKIEAPPKTTLWRPCPAGQHWRKAHIQPTYIKSNGVKVRSHAVRAGCCDNPSKKDQIYSEELLKIASEKFSGLSGPPKADDLGFKRNGNRYDDLIRGWTYFWNDILKPDTPLDPNLVKALIASESGFNPSPKVGPGKARGLMQITDTSRKILENARGELKDHLIHIDQKDITDPNFNIAAGIRWLFHKKDLATSKLGRPASWEEAVTNYKSLLEKKDKRSIQLMNRFRDYYKNLLK